jgi:hypothetical protein
MLSLGGDKAYDTSNHVDALRSLKVTLPVEVPDGQTLEREIKTGDSWEVKLVARHRALNLGTTTGQNLLVEFK